MNIVLYPNQGDEVAKENSQIAVCTLAELLDVLPKDVKDKFHIKVDNHTKLSKNLGWYEHSAFLPERKQIAADNMLFDFIHDPLKEQDHHVGLVILNKDMTARDKSSDGKYIDFLFGLATSGAAIISFYRFNSGIKNKKDRRSCIRRAVLHEFFHTVGLIPYWRKSNIDNRLGLHCKNVCVMRQGMNVSEWKNHALEEDKKKIILCPQCVDNLLEVLSHK